MTSWALAAVMIVLGGPWGGDQQGYGHPHPRTIFNGGDPTGLVTHIRWKGWGSATATGTGTGDFVWPGLSVASGSTRARATVVAWDRRRCKGRLVYRHLTWYFPGFAHAVCAEQVASASREDQVAVTGVGCSS